MKNSKIVRLFFCFVLHLFHGNTEESLVWFNSCSTPTERHGWKLDGSAQFINEGLTTTSSGNWCHSGNSFKGLNQSLSWMIKFREGEGDFKVGLSSGNELSWKIKCIKMKHLGEYIWTSQIENAHKPNNEARSVGSLPFDTWLPFSIIRRDHRCEVWLNDQMIEKLNTPPRELSIAFKTTGTLLAECDEFEVRSISPETGTLDDLSLKLDAKLPNSWEPLSGIWSTAYLPRHEDIVVCQSMENHAELVFKAELTEGSSLSAGVRFEGKGQVGIGMHQEKLGEGYRVLIRQNVNNGIVGEQVKLGSSVMLFRGEVKVFPGIWYNLKMLCRRGKVSVELDGQFVGEFDAGRYGRPYLVSDGAASALFRDIKVQGLSLPVDVEVPIHINPSAVKSGSWQAEAVNELNPIGDSPYTEIAGQIFGLKWQTNWTWIPDNSKNIWLGWNNTNESFELNFIPVDQHIEVALFYTGKDVSRMRIECPGELYQRCVRGRPSQPFCIFKETISNDLWGKGIKIQMARKVFQGKNSMEIAIEGRSIGAWSLSLDPKIRLAMGSEGTSKIKTFFYKNENFTLMDQDGLKMFESTLGARRLLGGSFDNDGLASGQNMVLSTLLMAHSELLWNMGPRDKGAKMNLNLLDERGQTIFSSRVDFRQEAILTWTTLIPKKIPMVSTERTSRWNLGLKRDEQQLWLKINDKEFQSIDLPKGCGPLSVEWGLINGDFIIEKEIYVWTNAKIFDLCDVQRLKSATKDWTLALTPLADPVGTKKVPFGPWGKMVLKEKLGMNHQVFLQSRENRELPVGRQHNIEWSSKNVTFRISIILLDDGCEVRFSKNDKVCHVRRLQSQQIQLLAGVEGQNQFRVWLAGEPMGEAIEVESTEWTFSIQSESSTSEQLWHRVIWKNQ